MLQQSVGRKRIFTSNSRSRSFKVIHFAISYRPTRGKGANNRQVKPGQLKASQSERASSVISAEV